MRGENKIQALDGVRGFAAGAVVVFHAHGYASLSAEPVVWERVLHPFIRYGWAGVDLFFVLSGFLITRILLRSKGQPNYFLNFYARRSLRIFPIYYLSLGIIFFLLPEIFAVPHGEQVGSALPWYLLYLQNWGVFFGKLDAGATVIVGHFWSLAVEEQFYLLWPWLVWRLKRRSLFGFCVAAILFIPVLRLFLLLGGWGAFPVYSNTIARADCLLAGALVALIFLDERWRAKFERVSKIAGWGGIAGLLAIYGLWGSTTFTNKFVLLTALSMNLTVGSCLIFRCATEPGGRVARVFCNPVLRWMGKYSYAIYIVHIPVMWLLWEGLGEAWFGGEDWWSYLFFLVFSGGISAGIALASWHLCEKHFLKLKRRFAST